MRGLSFSHSKNFQNQKFYQVKFVTPLALHRSLLSRIESLQHLHRLFRASRELEVCFGKNCPRGRRLRTALKTEATVFPVRIDLGWLNNILIFFLELSFFLVFFILQTDVFFVTISFHLFGSYKTRFRCDGFRLSRSPSPSWVPGLSPCQN